MSCGNLFLQDPLGRFWVLSAQDSGNLVTVLTPTVISPYTAPVINSPSFHWQLSATLTGTIAATPVISPPVSSASFLLSSPHARTFTLTITDVGVLLTTSLGLVPVLQIPYPTDVSMSVFPNTGLTSSLAGATPLTISADFSIWSCTLNQFVNVDTTNIVVVLDE